MSMTDRVWKLRQQSLDARETLSSERAELLTDFYTGALSQCPASVPIQRALAFQYLMEHKAIYIGEGELIVGEKGPAPKVAPTYPELCCHSLEDLDILDSRPKTSYKVNSETRKAYAEKMIPFWGGRSLRDLIFSEMTDEWKAAYEAGIFTEFMEQRAPGHTVLDGWISSLTLRSSLPGLIFYTTLMHMPNKRN
jgi:pyruvate-formate lyase